MKKSFLLVLMCLFALVGTASAQKVKPVNYGGTVNLVKEMPDNVIVVRSLGYGKNEATAREDAEVRVMRAVMYVGFPKYSKFIAESDAEAKHAEFISNFFDGKRYKDFIVGVESVGDLTKVKGQKVKQMPFDITVNHKALRQHLRENGIGKLGFGR